LQMSRVLFFLLLLLPKGGGGNYYYYFLKGIPFSFSFSFFLVRS
jgi:hypothetical protein